MREFKFRGMSKDGVWHYGSLVRLTSGVFMIHEIKENSNKNIRGKFIEVIANTIGQYIGMKDENGKEIYRGDLVKINGKLYMIKYKVGSVVLVRCFINTNMYEEFKNCWNDDVYPISQYYWENNCVENTLMDCIAIGNIYENKELLENK